MCNISLPSISFVVDIVVPVYLVVVHFLISKIRNDFAVTLKTNLAKTTQKQAP